MLRERKRLLCLLMSAALIFMLALPCLAEDELDNAEEQSKSVFIVQAVGIALVVIVVIIILIKNRTLIFKSPSSSGSSQPLDEDKVSDEIRLSDPDFKRDEFKAYAGKVIVTVLNGITSRSASALRPFESDNQYSEHEKMLREYTESRHTNHFDDLKLLSTELASYEVKGDTEHLTVRATLSMLDYTSDDSNGDVLDGSKLAKRTRPYRMSFVRRKGLHNGAKAYVGELCPVCSKPLSVTPSGKCAECKANLCDGSNAWMLDSLTKWGRDT